jgi:hypothetical protein
VIFPGLKVTKLPVRVLITNMTMAMAEIDDMEVRNAAEEYALERFIFNYT